MLKFTRNKLISVEMKDQDTLVAHGILDDDIYSLEIDVTIDISNMKILVINGKWNRWTTPECPRAIPFLQEIVGFCIEEEGFSQKTQKIVSRKACRHYANLLLECCHAAKETAMAAIWEDEKVEETSQETDQIVDTTVKRKVSGGMIIDLHIHTYPASPCSSASADQLIKEAKRIGLDGICLTDNNYLWDPAHLSSWIRPLGSCFMGIGFQPFQEHVHLHNISLASAGLYTCEVSTEAPMYIHRDVLRSEQLR